MKVALVCTGLGHIQRGYETFTEGLFRTLKDEIDINLFKGGGTKTDGEIIVPNLRRNGLLSRFNFPDQKRYFYEQLSFALFLIPHLLQKRFDIVHYSDYDFGRYLQSFKRRFGLKSVLLFSNGAPCMPKQYANRDFIQLLTFVHYQEAVEYGIPESRLALVPYGIDCKKFHLIPSAEKKVLRQQLGLSPDKFIVLCVAALKKEHKRIDWLIQEFAPVVKTTGYIDQNRFSLLMVGQRTEETEELETMAQRLLGPNFQMSIVPHEEIPQIYQIADCFVLPSLREGFGIVLMEAMATQLAVLAHDAPIFRWVIGNDMSLIDMSAEGQLAHHIQWIATDDARRLAMIEKNSANVLERFEWSVLKNSYIEMYQKAMQTQ